MNGEESATRAGILATLTLFARCSILPAPGAPSAVGGIVAEQENVG